MKPFYVAALASRTPQLTENSLLETGNGQENQSQDRWEESGLSEWEQESYKSSGREQGDRIESKQGQCMEGFHEGWDILFSLEGDGASMEMTEHGHGRICSVFQ